MVNEQGLSTRQACRAARLTRSAYYAPGRPRQDDAVIAAIEAYIAVNPVHGFDTLYPAVRPLSLENAGRIGSTRRLG